MRLLIVQLDYKYKRDYQFHYRLVDEGTNYDEIVNYLKVVIKDSALDEKLQKWLECGDPVLELDLWPVQVRLEWSEVKKL